jgi:beta-glucosidase
LKTAGFSINDTVYNALKASGIKTDVKGKIAEVPVSFYTDSLRASYASSYNDAAIVMFSRFGGEEAELAVSDPDGVPQLSFHQQEADVLKMIKDSGKFGKTVVLINSGFAMDLGWLEDPQYGVDACLWVGFPGGNGFTGVANILTGAADPSGSFGDTYATDSLSAPAMRNFGDFTLGGISDTLYKNKYLVYAEGIYVGYKYYETRYQDQVLGINNATGNEGAFMDTAWDYAKEMAYPFGYGNSYAEFTREVESITWDRAAHTVTAVVNVTNDGAPAGSAYTGKSKAAVQLYVQPPYEAGQAEKSAIQLVDFGKTKELAKGETDTVTIVADDYLFATYDRDAANGADATKKGCYVFDDGDYYFAVGGDCHDALNNVLAVRDVEGMFSPDGTLAAGDAGNAVKVNLSASDNTSYARSRETGEIVCNQFDDADLNYFIQGKVEYLTRGDWDTYPETVTSVNATDAMKTQMEGKVYTKPAGSPQVESFKRDVKNGIKFVEMRGVGYDDPLWDDFIDQLSLADLCNIPGEKMANDAIKAVAYPYNSSGDGPHGLMMGGKLYVAEGIIASTMNKDLLIERGKLMSEEAYRAGSGGIYAPGANLHRTAYAGRNGEYYSEDSILSYDTKLCLEPEKAAIRKNELCYIRLKLTDKDGTLKPLSKCVIGVKVSGGKLLGLGHACPYNKEGYLNTSTGTYYGEAMAVIEPTGNEIVINAESVYGAAAATVRIV